MSLKKQSEMSFHKQITILLFPSCPHVIVPSYFFTVKFFFLMKFFFFFFLFRVYYNVTFVDEEVGAQTFSWRSFDDCWPLNWDQGKTASNVSGLSRWKSLRKNNCRSESREVRQTFCTKSTKSNYVWQYTSLSSWQNGGLHLLTNISGPYKWHLYNSATEIKLTPKKMNACNDIIQKDFYVLVSQIDADEIQEPLQPTCTPHQSLRWATLRLQVNLR